MAKTQHGGKNISITTINRIDSGRIGNRLTTAQLGINQKIATMAMYKISPLSLPPNYTEGMPNEINDSQIIVGWCRKNTTDSKAVLWQGSTFHLLNVPGLFSKANSLNSKQNVAGYVDDKPFVWRKSTGVTTILKGFDGLPAAGHASGINDADQITGTVLSQDHPAVVWPTSNAIPVSLMTGVPFRWPYTGGIGLDINNKGYIVGNTYNFGPLINQGFKRDTITKKLQLFLDPAFTGSPDYIAKALNDLSVPQIVGGFQPNYGGYHPYLYDVATAGLQDLSILGQDGVAQDINNSGDTVGYSSVGSTGTAVLWTFNGLISTNLNHPSISNALASGWQLRTATSINNNGYIVGFGYLNGDTSRMLPWILKPIIPIYKIPVEYMFPQALWPGQAHDGPPPRRWPLKFPFPIPSPSPFQFVGRAFTQLNNILASKDIIEKSNSMSDNKARSEIQKIARRVITVETKKLNATLTNSSSRRK